jgi:hypothetical protein
MKKKQEQTTQNERKEHRSGGKNHKITAGDIKTTHTQEKIGFFS